MLASSNKIGPLVFRFALARAFCNLKRSLWFDPVQKVYVLIKQSFLFIVYLFLIIFLHPRHSPLKFEVVKTWYSECVFPRTKQCMCLNIFIILYRQQFSNGRRCADVARYVARGVCH